MQAGMTMSLCKAEGNGLSSVCCKSSFQLLGFSTRAVVLTWINFRDKTCFARLLIVFAIVQHVLVSFARVFESGICIHFFEFQG